MQTVRKRKTYFKRRRQPRVINDNEIRRSISETEAYSKIFHVAIQVELSRRQSNVMGRRDASLRVKNVFRMMQKIGFLNRKIPADLLRCEGFIKQ